MRLKGVIYVLTMDDDRQFRDLYDAQIDEDVPDFDNGVLAWKHLIDERIQDVEARRISLSFDEPEIEPILEDWLCEIDEFSEQPTWYPSPYLYQYPGFSSDEDLSEWFNENA